MTAIAHTASELGRSVIALRGAVDHVSAVFGAAVHPAESMDTPLDRIASMLDPQGGSRMTRLLLMPQRGETTPNDLHRLEAVRASTQASAELLPRLDELIDRVRSVDPSSADLVGHAIAGTRLVAASVRALDQWRGADDVLTGSHHVVTELPFPGSEIVPTGGLGLGMLVRSVHDRWEQLGWRFANLDRIDGLARLVAIEQAGRGAAEAGRIGEARFEALSGTAALMFDHAARHAPVLDDATVGPRAQALLADASSAVTGDRDQTLALRALAARVVSGSLDDRRDRSAKEWTDLAAQTRTFGGAGAKHVPRSVTSDVSGTSDTVPSLSPALGGL